MVSVDTRVDEEHAFTLKSFLIYTISTFSISDSFIEFHVLIKNTVVH
jgi:hypothetical protein